MINSLAEETLCTLKTYAVNLNTIESRNKGIIIDSGSTVHIFKRPESFVSWDHSFNPHNVKIMLADGRPTTAVKGKGKVKIEVMDHNNEPQFIELFNVLYMPDLHHDGIISVKKGMKYGNKFFFSSENSFMIVNNIKVPLSEKHDLFFCANLTHSVQPVKRSLVDWHRILGHLDFRAVSRTQEVVSGMKITHKNKNICRVCVRGKAKLKISRVPDARATRPFEFIHTDVSGPKNIPGSIGDAQYVITFVDDYSNFIFCYYMKSRCEVIKAFKAFLSFTKRFGQVCRICTDNATEYKSNDFRELFLKHSIHHEASAPYTPRQNGTAERSFQTLANRARCILEDSKLSLGFWPLSYLYAAYLYNRSFVSRISCTPFQLIYGRPPDLNKMLRFGSEVEAYIYKPDNKMSPRTKSGIFVGFDRLTSAPHIYFPDENFVRPCAQIFPMPEEYPDDQHRTSSKSVAKERKSEPEESHSHESSDTDLPADLNLSESLPIKSLHGSSHDDSVTSQMANSNSPVCRTVDSPLSGCRCEPINKKKHHVRNSKDSSEITLHGRKRRRGKYINDSFCNNSDRDKLEKLRPIRNRKAPIRFGDPVNHDQFAPDACFTACSLDYVYSVGTVPRNHRQAMKSDEQPLWKGACDQEYKDLVDMDTFEIVPRPTDHEVLGGGWVFSRKTGLDGSIKFKARYVARGCYQKYGESFTDTYAPMSRMTTIRCMMFMCAQYGFVAHQLDVTTAYLNAPLDHTIYIEQPEGYNQDKSKVCRLKKSLYGLKQSAKLWNDTIHAFFVRIGFQRSSADLCLYRKHVKTEKDNGIIFVIIWVDDIVVMSDSLKLVEQFKRQIKNEYRVKDLGKLKIFLGIEFSQKAGHVQMSQSKYCKNILERFGMMDCNPAKIPCEKNIHDQLRENKSSPIFKDARKYRELVGSLIYLEQVTRPDISFVTNILSQNMANPTQFHWDLGLKTLRYLKGTQGFTLNYHRADSVQLTCFADADWGNGLDRKSQSGYMCYLNTDSSPISWSSRKQNLVATSTCNAEYVAISEGLCETIWCQKVLKFINLRHVISHPAQFYCDNTGAIALAENPCHHRRSKHIDIKYHHVRDHLLQGTIKLDHVSSKDNCADGFTKALALPLFRKFKSYCSKLNDND